MELCKTETELALLISLYSTTKQAFMLKLNYLSKYLHNGNSIATNHYMPKIMLLQHMKTEN